MPLYDFRCKNCGTYIPDVLFKHKDLEEGKEVHCPQCFSLEVEPLVGQTNFELKGKGWGKDSYQK